ncbi:MAG: 3-keto-disaccharide hydrolase [Opitutaceae bacterium]
MIRPKYAFILLSSLVSLQLNAANNWEQLLDKELSKFEIWMGVPHETVEGLPEGTYQSDNVHKGTPMGLDADVKDVFTVIEEDGELVLKVTGEIYGGLSTRSEFENYHMRIQARWGDQKWEPRLNALRDSGILYHCYGEHGSFWNVWKSSLEFQVQETDMGDFIEIAGPKAEVRVSYLEGVKRPRYDPDSEQYAGGYISANPEPDSPHGEWNQLDLFVIGNYAIHVVNGEVVMVVENARKPDGSALVKGQIQLQSEAAEVFYKDFKIRNIADFPAKYRDQVRFKGE